MRGSRNFCQRGSNFDVFFIGDPDQYCQVTLDVCDFSGGGGPDPLLPPSGSAHAGLCNIYHNNKAC